MRLTLKAISKGNHGGYHTIADTGRAELIEDMGVNAKRIPTWLLPNSCLLVTGMEPADRHKIRPDIMLTEMTHQKLMRYTAEDTDHLARAIDYHQKPETTRVQRWYGNTTQKGLGN